MSYYITGIILTLLFLIQLLDRIDYEMLFSRKFPLSWKSETFIIITFSSIFWPVFWFLFAIHMVMDED